MADIKGLDIFGNNKGLAKIKKEAEAKKKQQAITPSENKQLEVHQVQEIKTSSNVERQSRGRTKKVGAPIRKFDKVYSTKHPLKLSTLLNATSRVLVCLLYTSDAADEEDSVDLGGRRIIKKKNNNNKKKNEKNIKNKQQE